MYPRINNPKPKFDWIQAIICFIFISALAIIFYFLIAVPIPLVKFSASTGKCVEIEIKGEIQDCSCLKDLDKYEKMWVK